MNVLTKDFIKDNNCPKKRWSFIAKDAAEDLSKISNEVNLDSLKRLSYGCAEKLSKHQGNLILPEELILEENVSELFISKPGKINGQTGEKYHEENHSKLKAIKYKKMTSQNFSVLLLNGLNNYTSISNCGAIALSTDEGIDILKKALIYSDYELFGEIGHQKFGYSSILKNYNVTRASDLSREGAESLYRINKLLCFNSLETKMGKLTDWDYSIPIKKLNEETFSLWTLSNAYNIREVNEISVGAAKLIANYEGDTGYGSDQGFYFDELQALNSEAKLQLGLSYHKIRLPQCFADALPPRVDITTQVAENYVNTENVDIIKSCTHLCDESAARCLTYFKDINIVMPKLKVISTECAESLGLFHMRNLQIDSIVKISNRGLVELSKKKGTINGLNPKEWVIENSHLANN